MREKVVLLLSGPVAAGKSTLASVLMDAHGYKSIRSGQYLQALARSRGLDVSRKSLQGLGDSLDETTEFAWLIDDVAAPLIDAETEQRCWLLDSVRKPQQVAHFRRRFPDAIVHVHVVVPEAELRRRYERRLKEGGEYEGGTPYEEAVAHPNEVSSRGLSTIADLTIDASRDDAVRLVLSLCAYSDG